MSENLEKTKQENILFFSDLHLKESELEECSLVLDEIASLCKEHSINRVYDLSDTFDNVHPSSRQLDLYSSFIKKVNLPFIILSSQSHQSETFQDSIINHFGILKDTISVIKEYNDGNKLFCGHFGLQEAKLTKFGATHSQKEFDKFRWVILGHFHSHEIIKPNCVQLGSCRWIDFSEVQDKNKMVLIIKDYNGEKPECLFIPLKSPYPMISLELGEISKNKTINGALDHKIVQPACSGVKIASINDPIAQLLAKLDKLPPKTKVRVVFKDYSLWTSFLPHYQRYKDKFVLFKDKKEFVISLSNQEAKKETNNLSESLKKWIEINKVPEKIATILLEEIK